MKFLIARKYTSKIYSFSLIIGKFILLMSLKSGNIFTANQLMGQYFDKIAKFLYHEYDDLSDIKRMIEATMAIIHEKLRMMDMIEVKPIDVCFFYIHSKFLTFSVTKNLILFYN